MTHPVSQLTPATANTMTVIAKVNDLAYVASANAVTTHSTSGDAANNAPIGHAAITGSLALSEGLTANTLTANNLALANSMSLSVGNTTVSANATAVSSSSNGNSLSLGGTAATLEGKSSASVKVNGSDALVANTTTLSTPKNVAVTGNVVSVTSASPIVQTANSNSVVAQWSYSDVEASFTYNNVDAIRVSKTAAAVGTVTNVRWRLGDSDSATDKILVDNPIHFNGDLTFGAGVTAAVSVTDAAAWSTPRTFAIGGAVTSPGTLVDGSSSVTFNVTSMNLSAFSSITGSMSGARIAANSLPNAALSNVATTTIKGRSTAGTGAVEDLTATQVRTILNVANGATANDTDANLKNRANHTGSQNIATTYASGTVLQEKAALGSDFAIAGWVAATDSANTQTTTLGGLGDVVLAQNGLVFRPSIRQTSNDLLTMSTKFINTNEIAGSGFLTETYTDPVTLVAKAAAVGMLASPSANTDSAITVYHDRAAIAPIHMTAIVQAQDAETDVVRFFGITNNPTDEFTAPTNGVYMTRDLTGAVSFSAKSGGTNIHSTSQMPTAMSPYTEGVDERVRYDAFVSKNSTHQSYFALSDPDTRRVFQAAKVTLAGAPISATVIPTLRSSAPATEEIYDAFEYFRVSQGDSDMPLAISEAAFNTIYAGPASMSPTDIDTSLQYDIELDGALSFTGNAEGNLLFEVESSSLRVVARGGSEWSFVGAIVTTTGNGVVRSLAETGAQFATAVNFSWSGINDGGSYGAWYIDVLFRVTDLTTGRWCRWRVSTQINKPA